MSKTVANESLEWICIIYHRKSSLEFRKCSFEKTCHSKYCQRPVNDATEKYWGHIPFERLYSLFNHGPSFSTFQRHICPVQKCGKYNYRSYCFLNCIHFIDFTRKLKDAVPKNVRLLEMSGVNSHVNSMFEMKRIFKNFTQSQFNGMNILDEQVCSVYATFATLTSSMNKTFGTRSTAAQTLNNCKCYAAMHSGVVPFFMPKINIEISLIRSDTFRGSSTIIVHTFMRYFSCATFFKKKYQNWMRTANPFHFPMPSSKPRDIQPN